MHLYNHFFYLFIMFLFLLYSSFFRCLPDNFLFKKFYNVLFKEFPDILLNILYLTRPGLSIQYVDTKSYTNCIYKIVRAVLQLHSRIWP